MRLAAFEPDIPQNLGAMIRIGACFSIPVDVIGPCGFPFSVKALRRAAMDYADIADITHHADWRAFRATVSGRIVLMTTRSQHCLWDVNLLPGDTLLMGSESSGVPDSVHNSADIRARIPVSPPARSLNVAVAAGIAVAEAARQTGGWTKPER